MSSETFLLIRERLIILYKKYEKWLIPIGKYLIAVWMLGVISQNLGYAEALTRSNNTTALAFICMFLPIQVILVMMMGIMTMHLLAYNLVFGAVAAGVFLVVYVGFIRLYPKESLCIVLTMAAFSMKVEYMVPILVGLLGGVASMGAAIIGVVGHYMSGLLSATIQSNIIKTDYMTLAEQMMDLVIKNIVMNETMLGTIIIFACVFIIVNFIRRQAIDYAPYIGIIIGGIINILGFTYSMMFLEIQIDGFTVAVVTGLGILLGSIIQLFMLPLDYVRTENVRFEDENHVYFVKVIPKVRKNASVQNVEQIFTSSKKNKEKLEESENKEEVLS